MAGRVTEALGRVKHGDPNAPTDLEQALQAFWQRMLRYVRNHRAPAFQAVIETEGIVNAAFGSILSGIGKDKFPALEDHQALEKLMTTLVARKLVDAIRKSQAGIRYLGPMQPLDSHIPDARVTQSPEEILEKFLTVCAPVHRNAIDIVRLRLEGFDNPEIAAKLNMGLRTVQLILQRIETAWENAKAQEAADDT